MSATRSPKVSERVAPKAADPQPAKKKHDDDDGPDFATLLRAWIESHRASLLDSLRRLGKQPVGSFFTCMVMAVALSLPMGLSLLLSNVERLGGSWQRAAQISLYLQLEAGPAQGMNRLLRLDMCVEYIKRQIVFFHGFSNHCSGCSGNSVSDTDVVHHTANTGGTPGCVFDQVAFRPGADIAGQDNAVSHHLNGNRIRIVLQTPFQRIFDTASNAIQ